MRQPTTMEAEQAREATDGTVQNRAPGEAEAQIRRHRRRRWLFIAVPLLVLVPLGGWIGLGWFREGAEPASLAEASLRFEHRHAGGAEAAGPLEPAEGVYEYRGSGSDHISLPPLTQSHGPGMPGTIVHGADGCWNFRIDYSSNHWQDWTYCSRAGGLAETAGRTFQRWDLGLSSIDNHSAFTCTSMTLVAGMQPGDSWRQTCLGHNDSIEGTTRSAGRMRFVGIERLRVGGETVSAYHLVQRRQISGGQNGTLRADVWFAPDGLPLRERHTIAVTTGSPIGDISYKESTDYSLVSLAPRG